MRTPTVTLLAFVAFLLCLCGCPQGSGSSTPESGTLTIDCEVPGTEVFLYGQRLGAVPLELTPERLEELGIHYPTPKLVLDGWGEGVVVGEEDEDETKFMLLVPETRRGEFLSIETPWGPRTKTGGGGWPGEFGTHVIAALMPANDEWFKIDLSLPAKAEGESVLSIELTATYRGKTAVDGYRPQTTLHWGTFRTPWRRRTQKETKLPGEWASWSPGESRTTSIQITTPGVAEDYSLFATFFLFEDETGNKGAGKGAAYSSSHLLRVR